MTDKDLTEPEAVERLAKSLAFVANRTGMTVEKCEQVTDDTAATLRALSAALKAEKLNCVTLLNDADLDYNRKTKDLIERHANQISDLKARAESAEAERDALKAELAGAVEGLAKCNDFARAFLARHQKEADI